MGRDERRAPLKTPAWEAKAIMNITRNKAKTRENTHTHTHTNRQRKHCSWLGLLKKKTMFDAKTIAKRICRGNSDKRHDEKVAAARK